MSDILPLGGSPVRAAIARAAERTGVDFDYLLAQARIESSLNPQARAGTSSAAGLYQFTKDTWLRTLDKHGAEHGLEWTAAAKRADVLALRFDPDAAALMAAELAGDNKDALTPVLGREPDAAELYLAHFLGAGGAGQFLSALRSDPGQSAAALLPKAAAANRGIFFERSGAPRSIAGVMDLMRGKVEDAMGGTYSPSPAGRGLGGGGANPTGFASPLAWEPPPQPLPNGEGLVPHQRPSMAQTLRDAFGLASPDGQASAPGFVRAAYGNLRSLGL